MNKIAGNVHNEKVTKEEILKIAEDVGAETVYGRRPMDERDIETVKKEFGSYENVAFCVRYSYIDEENEIGYFLSEYHTYIGEKKVKYFLVINKKQR